MSGEEGAMEAQCGELDKESICVGRLPGQRSESELAEEGSYTRGRPCLGVRN